MPTPTFLTGFEHGVPRNVNGLATLYGSNQGTTTSGDVVTSEARHGLRSLRFICTAESRQAQAGPSNFPAATRMVAQRFGLKMPEAPADLFTVAHISGPQAARLRYRTAGGILEIEIGGTAQVSAGAVPLGEWVLIEMCYDTSTGTAKCWTRINGGTAALSSKAVAAGDILGCRIGNDLASSTGASGIFFDDWLVGTCTTTPDWFGDGKVEGLVPDAASFGSSVSTQMKIQPANTTATPATALAAVDDVPMENTTVGWDYVQQATAAGDPDNTYVEVQFSNPTFDVGDTINAVQGIAGIVVSAASGTGTARTRFHRSDGAQDVHGDLSFNASEPRLLAPLLTPPAGGWTKAELEDIFVRFGFATDIIPTPGWSGFMVEVDTALASGPPPYTGWGNPF